MQLIALKKDDITTLHVCDAKSKCEDSVAKVTVEGKEVHYVNGKAETHKVSGKKCKNTHTPKLGSTSTNVYVYPGGTKRSIAKIGDAYAACGYISKSQQSTVYVS